MQTGLNKLLMYYGIYAPWDHSPKYLRFYEIKNPIIVLKRFFDARSAQSHEARLKSWRDHVVTDKYYCDQTFGPGVLYHDYELNIRLIESLHLLLLEHEHTAYRKKEVTAEQLKVEKEGWSWFPFSLTEHELCNPYIIVRDFFEEIKPQEFRDHMVEWLVAALSAQAINEELTASEIFTVYDHVNKLYSAAWVIRQRDYDFAEIKKDFSRNDELNPNETKFAKVSDLPLGKIQQTPAEKLALNEITKSILKIAPFVKAIFHIKNINNPEGFMLYLLIDDLRTPLSRDLNDLIENAVKHLIAITTIIESAKILDEEDSEKTAFLAYILMRGTMVYQADSLVLKERNVNIPYAKNAAENSYHHLKIIEANLCFDKIDYRIEDQKSFEAVVLIAQSMIATLQALIYYITGYKSTISELDKLSQLTLLFTDEIEDRFEQLRNLETDLYIHLIGAQADFDDIPASLSVNEAIQLKIELVNQRMIVKALMSESNNSSGL